MNLATLLSRKKQNTSTKVVLSGVKCGREDRTFSQEIKKKYATKVSAVQILNKISIEYDSAVPEYSVKSLGIHQELPLFEATCEIFKDKLTYACIGKPASQKKASKQNTAAKVLETLSTKYIFLEEKLEKFLITESNFYNINGKNT